MMVAGAAVLLALAVPARSQDPGRTPAEDAASADAHFDDVRAVMANGKNGVPQAKVLTQEDRRVKPETFGSFTERLDFIHDNLFIAVQGEVVRWDTLGMADEEERLPIPPSKFKFALEFEIVKEGPDVEVKASPDAEIDLRIPNLEKRARVFVDFSNVDDLPGTTISDRDSSPRIGVGTETRVGKKSLLDTKLGVKWKLPPVGFGELTASRLIDWDEGHMYPKIKGYYETDDGFGSQGTLVIEKWPARQCMVQSVSAVNWAENTEGMEWEQSFLGLYLLKAYVDKNVELDNIHRGLGLKASAFGHKVGAGVVDRYRLTFGYRFALYKHWIYMTIYPEVNWVNDFDWSTDPGLRIGLDMLFWGTPQR